MRILHIAPFNIAGVPITLVKAERKRGHHSRLVTLGRDARNYEEDICLDLPFLNFWGTRLAKRMFSHPSKLAISNQRKVPGKTPLKWEPAGWPESTLVGFREWFWKSKVEKLIKDIDFWNFDVYQLDGGMEFFRNGQTIKRLKTAGKKIICCYTGSDLRTRGVIAAVDAAADLNVTFEFDHLQLHPNIEHVFFPFDAKDYEIPPDQDAHPVKIGHAPTNRQAKGSDIIIAAITDLQLDYAVELVLIENLPHSQALQRKSQCQIFVDQIGELGYGINSLESLAMGISTCSSLAPGFEKKYPDHPFVVIDEGNIKQKLRELIQNERLRHSKGQAGRVWVKVHHDSEKVVQKIHKLAGLEQILHQGP